MEKPADDQLAHLREVVDSSTMPTQIVDHILSAVFVGALPAGTALPAERDLAAGLNVSRSSVRAALERLERAGVVVRRRGRGGGTFIAEHTELSSPALRQRASTFRSSQKALLEARVHLQSTVTGLAAGRITTKAVVRLRAAVCDYRNAADPASARAADRTFHRLIARASGNDVLARMCDDLDAQINAGFRHDPFSAELFERACRDHVRILCAVEDGDGELAARLTDEHFRATSISVETRSE